MLIMISSVFCLAVHKEIMRDMINAFCICHHLKILDCHQSCAQDPEHFVLKGSPCVKNTFCCRPSRSELTAASSLISVLLYREMVNILFLFTRPAFSLRERRPKGMLPHQTSARP